MGWSTIIKKGTAIIKQGKSAKSVAKSLNKQNSELVKEIGTLAKSGDPDDLKKAKELQQLVRGNAVTSKTLNEGAIAARQNKSLLARGASYVANNPKKAALYAGAAYLGWNYVVNDKSVVDSALDAAEPVSDVVIGDERVEKIKETAEDVKEEAREVKDKVVGVVDGADRIINGTGDEDTGLMSGIWNSVQNFLGGCLNKAGDFLSNLLSGKVGGMGIVGLVAAAFMIFGRFGWLGKIGGILLGAMIMNSNSRQETVSESERRDNSVRREQDDSIAEEERRSAGRGRGR